MDSQKVWIAVLAPLIVVALVVPLAAIIFSGMFYLWKSTSLIAQLFLLKEVFRTYIVHQVKNVECRYLKNPKFYKYVSLTGFIWYHQNRLHGHNNDGSQIKTQRELW